MAEVVMVGAAHGQAPLQLIEQLAVRQDQLPAALDGLRRTGCAEAVVLSTCGRTEIYAVIHRPDWATALLRALPGCGDACSIGPGGLAARSGRAAEAHLFRVTAGLESRVTGEVEIQGQVRAAARTADDRGLIGPRLRELFGAAVATARRAHRETGLAALCRSTGRSGVDAAIAGLEHDGLQVAIIGTGRMAATAFERFVERGIVPVVYGRSIDRAARVARGMAPAHAIVEVPMALHGADVVVYATSAATHLVTTADIRRVMSDRPDRSLTLLDLSVPRNVEPDAMSVVGVRLIDLEGLAGEPPTPEQTKLDQALAEAAMIVDEGHRRLESARGARAAGPVITRLHWDAEEACRRELRLLRPELLAEGTLDCVARAMSRRLVHRRILELREAAGREDPAAIQEIVDSLRITDEIRRPITIHRGVR